MKPKSNQRRAPSKAPGKKRSVQNGNVSVRPRNENGHSPVGALAGVAGAGSAPTHESAISGRVLAGFIVPSLPHPYLIPDANPSYKKIRKAYDDVRKQIEALK